MLKFSKRQQEILEKSNFWQNHFKQQKESGLSRVEYCKQHQLSYVRFGYWLGKLQEQPSSTLLPIHLDITQSSPGIAVPHAVCTLILKNGCELKIHDKSVLPILLTTLN